MEKKKDKPSQVSEPQRVPFAPGARPRTVTVDYDLYAHFLEDADVSEEQKVECLQTLWNIVVEFVSLGFGVHPAQQAQTACGKGNGIAPNSTILSNDTIQSIDQSLVDKFNSAEATEVVREEEGIGKS